MHDLHGFAALAATQLGRATLVLDNMRQCSPGAGAVLNEIIEPFVVSLHAWPKLSSLQRRTGLKDFMLPDAITETGAATATVKVFEKVTEMLVLITTPSRSATAFMTHPVCSTHMISSAPINEI